MERILAVGDIHGSYDKLVRLMEKLQLNPEKDVLIFMGDYIDRGNLIGVKKKFFSAVFLLGNHEQMLLDYLEGSNVTPFLINGGQKTLDSYFGKGLRGPHQLPDLTFPSEHLEFFKSLLPYYELKDYIFVHAGLKDGIPLVKQDLFDLLWIREEFYFSKFSFGKTIIFGHTPFPQPFQLNQRIGIDTGAVFGNKLTCVELPVIKFYTV
jgi:serine/threonine protein phosphatase 1